jgi:hypothetical protein
VRLYQPDGLRKNFGRVDWPGMPVPGLRNGVGALRRGYVTVCIHAVVHGEDGCAGLRHPKGKLRVGYKPLARHDASYRNIQVINNNQINLRPDLIEHQAEVERPRPKGLPTMHNHEHK